MVFCRMPQIRLFPRALEQFLRSLRKENSSSYRSLCTALAATVGTGNIAGVAGAIALGGPGSLFWMWLGAFLGMGVKFAEGTLAVAFREKDPAGGYRGGPMYIIRMGLPKAMGFLAPCYAFLGLFAAFGVGNATQANAVLSALKESSACYGFSVHPLTSVILGLLLGILVAVLVSGGAAKIGAAAELLVPVAALGYVLVCAWALWLRREAVPDALNAVVRGAFSPKAVTGGVVGSAFTALRIGFSRGVFTNEAGMGTAAMAHASAEVNHPADQGLMGIMEVFLDTIVICSMTALVILTSPEAVPYGAFAGAELTARALSSVLGSWASAFVCACLGLFALATILGWGLYAGRCAEFLLGRMNWRTFALGQGFCVLLGAVLETGIVWTLSELMNGLMAVPNLIALLFLLPKLRRLT